MRPQLGSRSDAVLTALMGLLAASGDVDREVDLADVQIIDGPIVGSTPYSDDVISVAAGTPEETGFTVQRIPQPGLGPRAYIERTEVTIIVSCYSGDTDMTARRHRATEVFDAVKRRVDAHQVQAGVWDGLRLGDQEAWHPVQSTSGCYVVVGFTVIADTIG